MTLKGKIAFASGKGSDFDIWSLNLETEELRQLTFGEWMNDQPKWSPDGAEVVYVSNKSGTAELWLMNEDGSNKRQVTKEGKFHSGPSWSPDGRRIICCANYDTPDEIEVWSISRDGNTKEKLLSAPGMEMNPSLSPDGEKLLISSPKGGNYDIWEVDLSSGQWRQITNKPSRDYFAAYSPDGEWIAYVSQPASGESTDIWVVDVKCENEPVQLTRNKGTDNDVSWSPDGKYIVYGAAGANSESRIRILNLETRLLENFSYDRSALEHEIGAEIRDLGLFSELTPDFIQRIHLKFFDSPYFGMERYPHWKY